MRSTAFALLLVCGAATTPMAVAEEIRASNSALVRAGGMTIQEVAAVFEDQSFKTEISSASELTAEAWGFEFEVAGYHCNNNSRCTEFLLVAGFDLPNGFPIEKINEWNQTEPAGRAFLDEDRDPFLDHTISVSGPADTGALYEGLILWLNALQEFDKFLDQHITQA